MVIATVVPSRFKAELPERTLFETLKKEAIWEDSRQRGEANRAKREGRKTLEKDSAGYDPSMSGVAFEKVVAEILERNGCEGRHTKVSGDQGVDLLATIGKVLIAIQRKRTSVTVGNKAVQEAAAGRIHYQASAAWVVTDPKFTASARQLAQSNAVELLHVSELRDAVGRVLKHRSTGVQVETHKAVGRQTTQCGVGPD